MRDKARLIEICKSLNPAVVPEAAPLKWLAELWESGKIFNASNNEGSPIVVVEYPDPKKGKYAVWHLIVCPGLVNTSIHHVFMFEDNPTAKQVRSFLETNRHIFMDLCHAVCIDTGIRLRDQEHFNRWIDSNTSKLKGHPYGRQMIINVHIPLRLAP